MRAVSLKPCLEDLLIIDSREFQRIGALNKGSAHRLTIGYIENRDFVISTRVAEDMLLLSYSIRGVSRERAIKVCQTPCNYGGSRQWFICTELNCRRRAAILYFSKSGRLACRHCQKLNYESQHLNKFMKVKSKIMKIRDDLGWSRGLMYGGEKPKSMHWDTFDNLMIKYKKLVQEHEILELLHIGKLQHSLKKSQMLLNAEHLAKMVIATPLEIKNQIPLDKSEKALFAEYELWTQKLIDECDQSFDLIANLLKD